MSSAIGGADVVARIRESTSPGLTIGAAIPPGFASYATVVIPDDGSARLDHDRALIEVLRQHHPDSGWWLCCPETGEDPLPSLRAPKVVVYGGGPFTQDSPRPGHIAH